MVYTHGEMVKQDIKGKFILPIVAALIATTVISIGTFAAKPANPGCFGRDRAENITTWIMDMEEPGASWWGHEASDRAGTNGAQNQTYKANCVGDPA